MTATSALIEAENGEEYPRDLYHETTVATGTQLEVANRWAEGALPTHSTEGKKVKLYTSTGNFRGYQYPDGRGMLKHYQHIEAIRTRSGLIISDTTCWSKGWAHCSTPDDLDARLPVTPLREELRSEDESIYSICGVSGDEVSFESGRAFDVDSWGWVTDDPVNVLGRKESNQAR